VATKGHYKLIEDQAKAQYKLIERQKVKDLKVKNYLFQDIDQNIIETILDRDTSNSI